MNQLAKPAKVEGVKKSVNEIGLQKRVKNKTATFTEKEDSTDRQPWLNDGGQAHIIYGIFALYFTSVSFPHFARVE